MIAPKTMVSFKSRAAPDQNSQRGIPTAAAAEQAANTHTPPCPIPNSAPSFKLS